MSKVRKQCGTAEGYRRHRRAEERPCSPCCDAHNAYVATWRIRSGRTKAVNVPIEVLAALLTSASDRAVEQASVRLPKGVVVAVLEKAKKVA